MKIIDWAAYIGRICFEIRRGKNEAAKQVFDKVWALTKENQCPYKYMQQLYYLRQNWYCSEKITYSEAAEYYESKCLGNGVE